MWFESIHVRIRSCMLTQTGILFDFPSVSLWPVCYLLIETDTQGLNFTTKKCKYLVSCSAVRPECFCVSGLMITDAFISDRDVVVTH